MNDPRALELLRKALHQMDFATRELNRPSSDVVALCACSQVKDSMIGMMKAFLMMNGKDTGHPADLEELRKECLLYTPEFGNIDLKAMDCYPADLAHDKHYCLGPERVGECLRLAEEIRDIVLARYRKLEKGVMN